MMERSHDELKDLVAAYVIGAVPPDEVRVVRAHILTCDACMAEADDYAAAMDSLALAVAPAPVPAGFVDRVMEQVRPVEKTPAPAAARSGARAWRSWFAPAAAGAAALVAIAVLGAGVVDARNDLARSEDALAQVIRSDEAVELKGTGGTTAELVPTNDGAVFAVAGLPEAPGSDIYQLWYMKMACRRAWARSSPPTASSSWSWP